MNSRSKLSLPIIDKSKRVQLSGYHPVRATSDVDVFLSRSKRAFPKTPRSYASAVRRTVGAPNPLTRNIAVPVPLKSRAIYYAGELSVHVYGDGRGHPDRNKFNVTITVVHKQLKARQYPGTGRKVYPMKRVRPPPDQFIDWDIINHRAMFPSFNTCRDPDANRRYMYQFGL